MVAELASASALVLAMGTGTVRTGTTDTATVHTGITATGDMDTTAIDPIADTGRAVHGVDGTEHRCRLIPMLSR